MGDIPWIGKTIIAVVTIIGLTAVLIVAINEWSPTGGNGEVTRRCSIPPGYLDPAATGASNDPNAKFTLTCDK